MMHILRAHQLCMEGYQSLFDGHLTTVWSAPNYCYRCGNSASILEVRPDSERFFFNVFQAAPENERDGPSQQAQQNAGGKVSQYLPHHPCENFSKHVVLTVTRVLPITYQLDGYPHHMYLDFRSYLLSKQCSIIGIRFAAAFFLAVLCA